ncbi:MAG: glucose-6-phosphate dehydrogenase [Planctomycetes bacterium]|nr:glucose-6-phosphate dehydrogenase [Planctomycetota bacterium]
MPEIQPLADRQEIACAEMRGEPCGMVVFGASGDLARRKLVGSLFELFKRGLLSEKFYFLGCGRKVLSDDDYRKIAEESIADHSGSDEEREKFVKYFNFISGDYLDGGFYERIKERLGELDAEYGVPGCRIFYLSIPPGLYGVVAENLGLVGLSHTDSAGCKLQPRLVIEKPFGNNLESAVELNEQIREHFEESQLYRIDHYLGKETVQNILMFRFANAIFEPVWNRNYIDHVQITIAESLGVGHRAGYYDDSGALRDMFQNHMLGMLAFVAMEAPASFDADGIRGEKVKLLRSIRPIDAERVDEFFVRGQYGAGVFDGEDICGYLDEEGVRANSVTETFVAGKLFIDNWRWKDVPFYLRTGKRMGKRVTEIAITFKRVPHSMFASVGLDEMPANVLVLKIQPNEGIRLNFQAKRPGSKTCMSTLTLNFNYSDVFGTVDREAYERLLLDCMVGDQTLFNHQDDVEVSWGLLGALLEAWGKSAGALEIYAGGDGAESFAAADKIIESDGREWRKLSEM